jgi:hypothetical protein
MVSPHFFYTHPVPILSNQMDFTLAAKAAGFFLISLDLSRIPLRLSTLLYGTELTAITIVITISNLKIAVFFGSDVFDIFT